MHRIIKAGNPGTKHKFDILPENPAFFKIECKIGYSSPIIITM